MTRVAIVEDHVLVRDALVHELTALGLQVVSVSTTLDGLADRSDIDVVLLDLNLGDRLADPEVVARLVTSGVAVLVVSALGNASHLRRMLTAGVVGVVAKQDALTDLEAAITAAVAGEKWTSPVLAAAMAADDSGSRPHLSDKELQALRLYACGLKLDSVARRMGISPSTAKQYIDRVRRKYELAGYSARTKTELYQAGIDDGFIEPPPRR